MQIDLLSQGQGEFNQWTSSPETFIMYLELDYPMPYNGDWYQLSEYCRVNDIDIVAVLQKYCELFNINPEAAWEAFITLCNTAPEVD